MSDYKLEPVDNGLYEYREDEFGRGAWFRIANYPPNMTTLREVLDWYETMKDEEWGEA